MSNQKAREEFVASLTKEGLEYADIAALLRAGTTLQRLAELECSSEAADRDRVACPGDYAAEKCLCRDYGTHTGAHGRVPRIAVKEYQTQRRVEKVLAKYEGFRAIFAGDPRGRALKIQVPSGRTDDWGQTGVCVP